MNKAELVEVLSEKSGLSKKDCEKCLLAFIDATTEAMQNGDKVALAGFGTFEAKARAERQGINPKTMEAITIKASKAPTFKAGKGLKDALNK